MKPAVIPGRAVPTQKHAKGVPLGESLREQVSLCDLTDCLLSAYDGVARLAYEKFSVRGKDSAGNELEDWLDAERELLGQMEVDVAETGDFVNALASVPGYRSAHISLGVEPNWMLIFARHGSDGHVNMPRIAHSLDPLRGPPPIDADSLAAMCVHAAREQTLVRGEKSGCTAEHLFCICELPAEVDPASCRAIVSDGVLGIRLAKVRATPLNRSQLLLTP
ncbi:MAG: Hsp20/alpha crystallin family protein [Candidatus Acidiferrales bacterium]